MEQKFHTPVMFKEALGNLNLGPGKIIVDATVGTGGHAQGILERIMPGGRLIGIDRDEESLSIARQRLLKLCANCEFVHGNFMDIDSILKGLNIKKVDGILFDLGVSSFQLEDPTRGFSFQNEGPLDMRLDRRSYISAYDLVNNLNEDEISTLLWNFGQERWHNRIAHFLVSERERQPIATTAQLANIVIKAVPARFRYRHYRMHPATRTFLGIRIAVNRELEALEVALEKGIGALKQNGRICVISFHSLEDRIVKLKFRSTAQEGLINIISPKPLTPAQAEVEENPKSRSSKLRVAQRT